MSQTAITLENVSKYYKLYDTNAHRLREALHPFGKKYHKEFYALKNINLTISKGEILGVVGKNGSGKSTLLKLVSSVLTPNSGEISVKGRVSALLELGSGFNPEFTGMQNIFFYGTIMGLSRREMELQLDNILSFADIGEFIHQPLKTYSSGMKARLGFAVAVHIEPEILILDEVLSVGDALFQRKCYAKMEEFFKGGKTIIYVSHSTRSITELCSRAVLLNKGKIVLDSDAKTVTEYYQRNLLSDNELPVSDGEGVTKPRDDNLLHKSRINIDKEKYIPDLIPLSLMEYKNADVSISGAKIVNNDGLQVNVLEFGKRYQFVVDVLFGVGAKNVSFGFDLKEEKGIVITSVESYRLYKNDYYYDTSNGDEFHLVYNFMCLYREGSYYLNFGVSSYDGEQRVLNRIVDILMFKAENSKNMTGGYVELIDSVEIFNNDKMKRVEILN